MITVVGATSWGTTLAVCFARSGRPVRLLTRNEEEAAILRRDRRNMRRLPDTEFPPTLSVTADADEALSSCSIAVLAVPAQTMRANVHFLAGYVRPATILVSGAKGIEISTGMRMSQVICEELPGRDQLVAVLSGPNLGKEIARGLPAATVVASIDPKVATLAQDLLITSSLRVYTNTDVIGVELGGAMKNVYALAAGISDGLGIGDNAKAGLITRGLAEMTRLGLAVGAKALTFAGLAGLGDLVATCASPLSSNHQLGLKLAQGESLETALRGIGRVAEGVPTTTAASRMAVSLNVDLPITAMIEKVLFHGFSPREAAELLMLREARSE